MALAWAVAPLLGLDTMHRHAVIFSALPPAVLNYIFAEKYKQEPERVASIVMISTASLLFIRWHCSSRYRARLISDERLLYGGYAKSVLSATYSHRGYYPIVDLPILCLGVRIMELIYRHSYATSLLGRRFCMHND